MRTIVKLTTQLLLLPIAVLASDGGLPSSSNKGSTEEDLIADTMSPAMKRVMEEARARRLAELAAEQPEVGQTDVNEGPIGSEA